MKILVCNCQGLGGSSVVSQLEEYCKLHPLNILFLNETKNKADFIKKVCRRIKFKDYHTVEPTDLSGGLALFWQQGDAPDINDHFGLIGDKITVDVNQKLMAPITENEVKKAAFGMKYHSAPGLDISFYNPTNYILQTDGAWDSNNKPAGGGVAIFDANYNLIEIWGRSFCYLDFALRSEAEVIRWSLMQAKDKGWS